MSEYVVDFYAVDRGVKCEPVVRCRDCKHYRDHMWIVITDCIDVCLFWHGEPTQVEADGFCAWGERRDA